MKLVKSGRWHVVRADVARFGLDHMKKPSHNNADHGNHDWSGEPTTSGIMLCTTKIRDNAAETATAVVLVPRCAQFLGAGHVEVARE